MTQISNAERPAVNATRRPSGASATKFRLYGVSSGIHLQPQDDWTLGRCVRTALHRRKRTPAVFGACARSLNRGDISRQARYTQALTQWGIWRI